MFLFTGYFFSYLSMSLVLLFLGGGISVLPPNFFFVKCTTFLTLFMEIIDNTLKSGHRKENKYIGYKETILTVKDSRVELSMGIRFFNYNYFIWIIIVFCFLN